MDSTRETVTGDVKLKLYKGNIIPASRNVASTPSILQIWLPLTRDDCYDQADSAGFINLFGLPIKVRALNDQALVREDRGNIFRKWSNRNSSCCLNCYK